MDKGVTISIITHFFFASVSVALETGYRVLVCHVVACLFLFEDVREVDSPKECHHITLCKKGM